jgi:hypothetical protein
MQVWCDHRHNVYYNPRQIGNEGKRRRENKEKKVPPSSWFQYGTTEKKKESFVILIHKSLLSKRVNWSVVVNIVQVLYLKFKMIHGSNATSKSFKSSNAHCIQPKNISINEAIMRLHQFTGIIKKLIFFFFIQRDVRYFLMNVNHF